MDKREKVIKGLDVCHAQYSDFYCRQCPYFIERNECMNMLHHDALELLKATEPRVMTLEEAKSVEGYVWVEFNDRPILEVRLFHDGFLLEAFDEPFCIENMNWPDYKKNWRYWTSFPTDEQRAATPWEAVKP